jgi:hypothetical protein
MEISSEKILRENQRPGCRANESLPAQPTSNLEKISILRKKVNQIAPSRKILKSSTDIT